MVEYLSSKFDLISETNYPAYYPASTLNFFKKTPEIHFLLPILLRKHSGRRTTETISSVARYLPQLTPPVLLILLCGSCLSHPRPSGPSARPGHHTPHVDIRSETHGLHKRVPPLLCSTSRRLRFVDRGLIVGSSSRGAKAKAKPPSLLTPYPAPPSLLGFAESAALRLVPLSPPRRPTLAGGFRDPRAPI